LILAVTHLLIMLCEILMSEHRRTIKSPIKRMDRQTPTTGPTRPSID
jgi:hypothetical protein